MAENNVIPLTEEELLYAVPPDKAKKGEAKVIPFTLAGKPVAGIKPLVMYTAPPVVEPASTTTSPTPSFFKENQTLLIVLGVVAVLAIGYYLYDQQRKKKERDNDSSKTKI